MPQPVAPSIQRELAECLAVADPRCGDTRHAWAVVTMRGLCPSCLLSLRDYTAAAPRYWPEPGLVTA